MTHDGYVPPPPGVLNVFGPGLAVGEGDKAYEGNGRSHNYLLDGTELAATGIITIILHRCRFSEIYKGRRTEKVNGINT